MISPILWLKGRPIVNPLKVTVESQLRRTDICQALREHGWKAIIAMSLAALSVLVCYSPVANHKDTRTVVRACAKILNQLPTTLI